MRVLCLRCDVSVEDEGIVPWIDCPSCGQRIRSRAYDMRLDRSGPRSAEDATVRQERRPAAPGAAHHGAIAPGPAGYGPFRPPPGPSHSGAPGPAGRYDAFDARWRRMGDRYAVPGRGSAWPARRRRGSVRRHVRGIFRFAIALWTALFAAYFVLGHLASLAAAALTVPDGLMRSEIGYRPSLILPWTDPPVAAWGPVALSGMPLVIYFALVVVAIAASVSWTLVRSPTLPSEVRNLAAFQGVRARSDALLLVHIFLIHFALVAVYYIALYVAGITFRTPGFDRMEDWEIAFHLANASVYEEVVTRVVLLGLPLLAFHAARGRMAPLRRYVLGGGLAFDRPAILLTIFSTWVFGYAHVVYGWDLWKLPPTLLGGLMFAYLFVRRGLHAAIVFHFMIDYLGTVEAMGFPWWYAGPLILLAGVLVLSSVPLGLWLAYRYSLKGLARSRTRRGAGRAAGGPDGRDAHPRG